MDTKWLSLGAQGSYPIVAEASTPAGPVYLLRGGILADAPYVLRLADRSCVRFEAGERGEAMNAFNLETGR